MSPTSLKPVPDETTPPPAPTAQPARPRISLDLECVEEFIESAIRMVATRLNGGSAMDERTVNLKATARALYVDLAGARFDQRLPATPGVANGWKVGEEVRP